MARLSCPAPRDMAHKGSGSDRVLSYGSYCNRTRLQVALNFYRLEFGYMVRQFPGILRDVNRCRFRSNCDGNTVGSNAVPTHLHTAKHSRERWDLGSALPLLLYRNWIDDLAGFPVTSRNRFCHARV